MGLTMSIETVILGESAIFPPPDTPAHDTCAPPALAAQRLLRQVWVRRPAGSERVRRVSRLQAKRTTPALTESILLDPSNPVPHRAE
jgi:hypothetical protein